MQSVISRSAWERRIPGRAKTAKPAVLLGKSCSVEIQARWSLRVASGWLQGAYRLATSKPQGGFGVASGSLCRLLHSAFCLLHSLCGVASSRSSVAARRKEPQVPWKPSQSQSLLTGVLPNRLAGRASVLASPNYSGILRKSGLARTLALPGNLAADLGNMPSRRLLLFTRGACTGAEVRTRDDLRPVGGRLA